MPAVPGVRMMPNTRWLTAKVVKARARNRDEGERLREYLRYPSAAATEATTIAVVSIGSRARGQKKLKRNVVVVEIKTVQASSDATRAPSQIHVAVETVPSAAWTGSARSLGSASSSARRPVWSSTRGRSMDRTFKSFEPPVLP